jgi:protein-export membrane protein SecD
LTALLAYFVYATEKAPDSRFKFKYGLDLKGGSHLIYRADTSSVSASEIPSAMESLKNVIERRVNLFGVSEAVVQVENSTLSLNDENRLIVELPGVTDLEQAVALIGKTPILEFKLFTGDASDTSLQDATSTEALLNQFSATGLTGRLLKRADLAFEPNSREPYITITFNQEGEQLFADITRNNVDKILGIFLDGEILSTPVIREEILGGQAQITGGFTPVEAKTLVNDLNLGALPLPIERISTQNVGATLGQKALADGVKAGLLGIGLVMLFMILYYRLPGLVAAISLLIYITVTLAIFKLVPITLTAAGIAGFILSVGMSVDANILIFERMKEEFISGKNYMDAARAGFKRAWLSIRDGNISTILSAIVLFWIGTSSVEGFALTLALGVMLSMFTAITLTQPILYAILPKERSEVKDFLFKTR